MPIDAGVGPLPRPHQTVARLAGLFDHERLKTESEALLLARDNQVLAQGPGIGFGSKLEEARAWHDGHAFYRQDAFGCSYIGQPRALARCDPAAVDQNVHAAALEPERREDVVSDRAVQHLVVEKKRSARGEGSARRDSSALEARSIDARRGHLEDRRPRRVVQHSACRELFLGAPRLPAGQCNGERDERRGGQAGYPPWLKL